MDKQILFSIRFLDNTLWDYIVAAFSFLVVVALLKFIQAIIVKRLRRIADKTETEFDNVLITIFENIRPPFYVLVGLYAAISRLTLSSITQALITILFFVAVVYEVVGSLEQLFDYGVRRFMLHRAGPDSSPENEKHIASMTNNLRILFRLCLWVVGLIVILANLGFDVTSLIASFGIGGVALALASQGILTDMFSSFTLYMDKPFRVGDFIVFGPDSGTVEKIGLKSTRVRTLQGEQLIVSNSELAKSRVQNFKTLKRRRVAFIITVAYGTDVEKLQEIPSFIRDIVDQTPKAIFDRCHFFEYGSSGLNFEVVFHIDSPDYNVYMDIRQKIHLEVYRRFQEENIKMTK